MSKKYFCCFWSVYWFNSTWLFELDWFEIYSKLGISSLLLFLFGSNGRNVCYLFHITFYQNNLFQIKINEGY
jgi:hypothetical protein